MVLKKTKLDGVVHAAAHWWLQARFITFTRSRLGYQARLRPGRRLLLPSCFFCSSSWRPGQRCSPFLTPGYTPCRRPGSSCFFPGKVHPVNARFTSSRPPVFLLLASCFFRRPSPSDGGVNGCPRLYTLISQ